MRHCARPAVAFEALSARLAVVDTVAKVVGGGVAGEWHRRLGCRCRVGVVQGLGRGLGRGFGVSTIGG